MVNNMKLKECLELGLECGLKDVGDAYMNVYCHAMNLFKYDEISKEISEINIEYNELYNKGLLNADMLIEDALKLDLK